jgi:hypothetical protein
MSDCGCGPTHDCGCGGHHHHDHVATGLDIPGETATYVMLGTIVGTGVVIGVLGTLAVQALMNMRD